MTAAEYWRKRFSQMEASHFADAGDLIAELGGEYTKASKAIEDEIHRWYSRFAENNEISLADARKWLNAGELQEFKWDVHEYIRKAQENKLSGQWVKQLENASTKAHISRLDAMNLRMQQAVEGLRVTETNKVTDLVTQTLGDSYTRTAYEVQNGTGNYGSFTGLDTKRIETLVNKPWAADGRTFSARIWSNQEQLLDELRTKFAQGLILGKSEREVADELAARFGVAHHRAATLVRTENAYFASLGQSESYKKLDVKKYQVLATLDTKTSAICQELDGQIFELSAHEVGVTAPPFHPNCRTTMVPYDEDWEDLPSGAGKRAARDADGGTTYVDGGMKYAEWKKEYLRQEAAQADAGGSWSGLENRESYNKPQAIERLRTEYGIDFSDSRKYPIDETLLSDCVSWLDAFAGEHESFMAKNPVQLPLVVNKAASSMSGTLGHYRYYRNQPGALELALNGKYHSDIATFDKYLEAAIKSKWTVANATPQSTFVHEFGHHVSNSMRWLTNTPRWEEDFLKDCIADFKKLEPAYTYSTYAGMGEFVSRYGATSHGELFAEAFSEYFGGENPRAFAQLFGQKLTALLKGVK